MIFFPSYEMLTSVYGMAEQSNLALVSEIIVQEPSMEERSREAFLEKFREQSGKPLIGFCVLGSIFSEGIDFTGNSLIGVLIVGTGLPQMREKSYGHTLTDSKKKDMIMRIGIRE